MLNVQQTILSADQRCEEREDPRARNLQKQDVRKINNAGITIALQNELSKRLEQAAFTKGKTEENWAKFKKEVDTAAKQTTDVIKDITWTWFDDNDSEIQGLLA